MLLSSALSSPSFNPSHSLVITVFISDSHFPVTSWLVYLFLLQLRPIHPPLCFQSNLCNTDLITLLPCSRSFNGDSSATAQNPNSIGWYTRPFIIWFLPKWLLSYFPPLSILPISPLYYTLQQFWVICFQFLEQSPFSYIHLANSF